MNNIAIEQLVIGDIITYVLPPKQRATNPAKEYQGIITHIFPQAKMVYVTVLTEGYEGMSEDVNIREIVRVQTAQHPPAGTSGAQREPGA